MWVSKKEYEDYGASLIHKRAPWASIPRHEYSRSFSPFLVGFHEPWVLSGDMFSYFHQIYSFHDCDDCFLYSGTKCTWKQYLAMTMEGKIVCVIYYQKYTWADFLTGLSLETDPDWACFEVIVSVIKCDKHKAVKYVPCDKSFWAMQFKIWQTSSTTTLLRFEYDEGQKSSLGFHINFLPGETGPTETI